MVTQYLTQIKQIELQKCGLLLPFYIVKSKNRHSIKFYKNKSGGPGGRPGGADAPVVAVVRLARTARAVKPQLFVTKRPRGGQ